jgi:hypothetical protein
LISSGKDHESDSHTRKFESVIEVRTNNPNGSEKQTHAYISNEDKEVEYKECSSILVQSCHEVNEYTKAEDIERREWEVDPNLSYP